MRTNIFRRLHRKLLVVDDTLAFVGGINHCADHLMDYGDLAKQDYAVRIEGPLCRQIGAYMRRVLARPDRPTAPASGTAPPQSDGAGKLIVRDNRSHRDDIERAYRTCVRATRDELFIANAYFFPGYRLLRDLAQAARRGVRVRLILQGQPDVPLARLAASTLYDYLLEAGVEIYEYDRRPLHAKVACFDQDWTMIGSSNLDPFSLALNLEVNVLARDRTLNAALRRSLEHLLLHDSSPVQRSARLWRPLHRLLVGVLAFHLLRRMPSWAGSLPAHKPRLERVLPVLPQTQGGP